MRGDVYGFIVKWASKKAEGEKKTDELKKKCQECLEALRHTVGLFGALEADLKATPKEELFAFPALHDFSRDVERLLAAVDRVIPKSTADDVRWHLDSDGRCMGYFEGGGFPRAESADFHVLPGYTPVLRWHPVTLPFR